MPGLANGAQAHWGLLCGVVVLTKENELTNEHYFKPELVLERDADRVWVVARHGKMAGPRYALWPLRELANSNRQLREPPNPIMQTNETVRRIGALFMNGYMAKRPRLEPAPGGGPAEPLSREQMQGAPAPSPPPLPPSPPATLPPPPPLPVPTPMSSGMEQHEDVDSEIVMSPYLFPEGTDLERGLANQYVSFEPFCHPNLICEKKPQFDDLIADVSYLNYFLLVVIIIYDRYHNVIRAGNSVHVKITCVNDRLLEEKHVLLKNNTKYLIRLLKLNRVSYLKGFSC